MDLRNYIRPDELKLYFQKRKLKCKKYIVTTSQFHMIYDDYLEFARDIQYCEICGSIIKKNN